MSGCLVDVDVDHLTKRVTTMVGPDGIVETRVDRFGPKGFPKFQTKETWTGWTEFVSEDFIGFSQNRYSFGIVDELQLQVEDFEQSYYPSKETPFENPVYQPPPVIHDVDIFMSQARGLSRARSLLRDLYPDDVCPKGIVVWTDTEAMRFDNFGSEEAIYALSNEALNEFNCDFITSSREDAIEDLREFHDGYDHLGVYIPPWTTPRPEDPPHRLDDPDCIACLESPSTQPDTITIPSVSASKQALDSFLRFICPATLNGMPKFPVKSGAGQVNRNLLEPADRLPAAAATEDDERLDIFEMTDRYLVDTGCPTDLAKKSDADDHPTYHRKLKEPLIYNSVGCDAPAKHIIRLCSRIYNITSDASIIKNSPNVLSIGLRVMHYLYSFMWLNGHHPCLISPEGQIILLDIVRDVPYLIEGGGRHRA